MTDEQKDFNFGCANLRIQPKLERACYQMDGEPCSQLIGQPKILRLTDDGDLCLEVNCALSGTMFIREHPRKVIRVVTLEEVKQEEEEGAATIRRQLLEIAAMTQANR